MAKTIVVFLRRSSQWDHDKPVREQAYWDDHARFMDALFEAGTVILAGPFEDGSGSMVIMATESVGRPARYFSRTRGRNRMCWSLTR